MTVTAPTTSPAATTTGTSGSLAALRDALPVLALAVATRAPRSDVVLDHTGTALTLSVHDDDVTARVTITLPTPAARPGRAVVTMKDLRAAVTALSDAGVDQAGDLTINLDEQQVRMATAHLEHVLPTRPAQTWGWTSDQAVATVKDVHAAITVLTDTGAGVGRAVDHGRVEDLRDVLTMPAGEFAANTRALARTTTDRRAYADTSMSRVPLFCASIELPAGGTVHLASTDLHRFTRWDTTTTWAHPATRVFVRADQLAAATWTLARQHPARPLTLAVAPQRACLTTTTPTGTHEVTLATVAAGHFPSLDTAVVGGPRRITLTRAAASRLARRARDQATRYGPESSVQLRAGEASTFTAYDGFGFHLDDIPATITGVYGAETGTGIGTADLDVTFSAAYLADALTALKGAIVMTSTAAPSDAVDDRTLVWTFTGTAPVTVTVAPIRPAHPRAHTPAAAPASAS